jgi:catalase
LADFPAAVPAGRSEEISMSDPTGDQPPVTTTDAGIPAASDESSLTAGPDGPILLQDHYLIQKLAQFNRERVPERVVHAKGGGAFGYFEATPGAGEWTSADFLQRGRRTPVLVRFSSVAGELGSDDVVRDPRGFAIKFYTQEGNYDLVGNNTPIFFIRDPQKFPDFIHSQKRLPDSNMRDNNIQWDFWTLSPETAHMVMWLMGDRGLPATWRHMNGYGSHTFLWQNARGVKHWVKYHLKTDQGIQWLDYDSAKGLSGEDPDHHLRDLFQAIGNGDHPSWTVHVQLMPFEAAADYRFNPFDLTKVWPHSDYPLVQIGRMVLDRNPENYFAQIEQAAFEPANMVPGIGPSPDRMLLGRMFAYPDSHRYRIGPNYLQLPVNAPLTPVHSYNKDGSMRYRHDGDRPVYAPNSFGGPKASPRYQEPGWSVDGEIVRTAYSRRRDDDDFGQAGSMYRKVLDEAARERLVANISNHLSGIEAPCGGGRAAPCHDSVVWRAIEYCTRVDDDLGTRVAARLGRHLVHARRSS